MIRVTLCLALLVALRCGTTPDPSLPADSAPAPPDAATAETTPPDVPEPDAAEPDASEPDAGHDAGQPVDCQDSPDPSACFEGLELAGESPCHLGPEPKPVSSLTEAPAFPNLSFAQPVQVTNAGDGTDRIFVVEKSGRILVFPNDPSVKEAAVFLDIQAKVQSSWSETGLLSAAFHPDYAKNGYVFLDYDVGENTAASPLKTRISRFHVSAGDPDAADPASELIVMEIVQPYTNHNGGQLAFGPDGMLYIGMGDGGSGGDPQGNGQSLTSLLGKMLRIDIDAPPAGLTYAVPPDNPFIDTDAARPEIWAYGLRNPWRFSFDPVTGQLWAGDVGQGKIEEIDIIEQGKNYGWNVMEGTKCYEPATGCDKAGKVLPVAEYTHSVGVSVTGGFVYRGQKLPGLFGAYVYGDFGSGVVFALSPPAAPVQVAKVPHQISTFGEDEAGELYYADYSGGKIWALTATSPDPAAAPFPTTLSDTGCFKDLGSLAPAPGVLPYDVRSPLWSDGAGKGRWVVLPKGGKVTWTPSGVWGFPEGTMFIKHFELDGTRLETRFLLKDKAAMNGVRVYTYRWNAAGTDAALVTGSATQEVGALTWTFPTQAQCLQCHTAAAGGVLGLHTGQLNRSQTYATATGTVTGNQIQAWAALRLFATPPSVPVAEMAAFPAPDDAAATPEARGRSYLQSNCAHCHQPGGTTQAGFDARWETSLADTGMCDALPQNGDLGVAGAHILTPGSPSTSLLWLRAKVAGSKQAMPPLAASLVNQTGVDALSDWISGLAACPQ